VIATIPVGYADGLDRHLSCGKGFFSVNGHKVPTIGNICMDMTMLDVTGVDVKEGDTVTIFGEDPTISELADILGTIPYEILTSVPRRIERIIVK
jgi:alanine racemase